SAAALAATAAGWAMTWLLWRGSRGMGQAAMLDDEAKARLPRIIAASLTMALGLLALSWLLGDALTLPGWRYLALTALIVGGMLLYAAAAQALGAFTLRELRSRLRRSAPPDPAD
ncbi:MAG: lipid II flippase MurJ, partial [Pseudomonadota bacterium]